MNPARPKEGRAGLRMGPDDRNDYTPEEVDFLKAVDAYKRHAGRKFPSLVELLDVLRSLDWRPPERPA